MGFMPILAAIVTTRMLVEVPMVVAIPPSKTAALTGISALEDAISPLAAIATMIGISSTITGVSLTNIDRKKASSSAVSRPSWALARNTLSSSRAKGSSAPVTTSPRPMIISAQIVISAEWPNPPKAIARPSVGLAPSSGAK